MPTSAQTLCNPREVDDLIEITTETAAFFPAGWKGTCRVHETVRKVYMVR